MTRIVIKDISYFFLYEGSEQFVEIGGGLDDKIAFDDVLIDKSIVVGNDAFEIIDDIDEWLVIYFLDVLRQIFEAVQLLIMQLYYFIAYFL